MAVQLSVFHSKKLPAWCLPSESGTIMFLRSKWQHDGVSWL